MRLFFYANVTLSLHVFKTKATSALNNVNILFVI